MQSLSDALNHFHDDAAWFTRAQEMRLFAVHCSGTLRSSVLALLPMFEFHGDNRSPWVVLQDPCTAQDDGWQGRANRLAAHWGLRRQALAEQGIAVDDVRVRSEVRGLAAFRATAGDVLRAIATPMRGLVIALAPTTVDDPSAFERQLRVLLESPELVGCRLVLVLDIDTPPPGLLVKSLDECGLLCECRVDESEADADLDALLLSGSEAPERFGMTWPRLAVPPPRPGAPPAGRSAVGDAALAEHGIDPAVVRAAPAIRLHVLSAAVAMKRGQGTDAIRHQREARDAAAESGLHEVAVICQIALASYLSGLGQRALALQELQQAVQRAATHGLHGPQSQAHLAAGLLHALDRNAKAAVAEYTAAGRAGEAGGIELLAIEGWRLAGQHAAQLGEVGPASKAFGEALRIGGTSAPDIQAMSSAAEAARALARIYGDRGMGDHAVSLYTHADDLEAGRATPMVQTQ